MSTEKDTVVALPKEGYLYSKIKPHIKPLDLILFKGSDFVSDMIRFLSYLQLGGTMSDDYSHAGIIVTRELFDDERLEPGKLYIWESTIGGKLGQDVYNIDNKFFFGTQIRDFDALIEAYDKPNNTVIAWCQLNHNPFNDLDKREELKTLFKQVIDQYNGIMYDMNFSSLFGALYKKFRCLREKIEKKLGTDKWLFCSELCAVAYRELGILPPNVNEKNVVPADFIHGLDSDKEIPPYFVKYPVCLVTPLHYDPSNHVDVHVLLNNANETNETNDNNDKSINLNTKSKTTHKKRKHRSKKRKHRSKK